MEQIFELVIALAICVGIYLYMRSVRNTIPKGERSDEPLTKKQRLYVLVMVIIAPIVAGAIFYYGWIKRYPVKAKKANTYSLIVFAVVLIVTILLGGFEPEVLTE